MNLNNAKLFSLTIFCPNIITLRPLLALGFQFSESQRTMKVHPVPNITLRYDTSAAVNARQKKLRRLPHIFAKVLELPFYSDADVSVEETPNSFKFVVDTDVDIGTDIATHTTEIVPGVIKIVSHIGVRVGRLIGSFPINELELKDWRFRLPASTHPELATAAFSDGELVVTVPKSE
ncbi:hypothetical protein L1987_29111 [Smallanthus sonchifolius]|uniref:Uncharacterized protein n=1 Tax=Smallanthus sonchifolius TaxID=185202 RepID=A0ACB9I0K9_9ASTR|nr:hypothetical protein L1987_29111 [Smallanthus sonchifolius]